MLVWGGGFFVAHLAFTNGDPQVLLRGSDYDGNTCGVGDYKDRPVLWYPFSFNTKTGDFVLQDALKMGLCVASCPKMGDFVPVYGNGSAYMPAGWWSLFKSAPSINRCMPDLSSFNCSFGAQNQAQVTQCLTNLWAEANNTWSGLNQFADTFEEGFQAVQTQWWVILAGFGIVIVLSFLWLTILRYIVKPVVVLTAILCLAAVVALGYVLWIIKGKKQDLTPPETDQANYYMYGAIAAWVIAFIYVCVMIFLWGDVMTACDIIEEATYVPRDIPTMLLVPPISFVACVPFLVWFVIVAVYIQSSGDVISFSLNATDVFASSAAANFTNNYVNTSSAAAAASTFLAKQYTFQNWRIYAHFYNLFVLLWSVGFVGAVCFMVIAMCGVYWYWSIPGDKKEPPLGSVCIAFKTVIRYHMGTLALGSFMVAVIQLLRVILAFIEHHMQQLKENTDAAKFIFTCLQCFLAYLERVVKFINKNGYIMCAMQGTSFVTSARDALNLLAANALSVGALTIISEYVIMFGKVLVTVAGTIATYFILQQQDTNGMQGAWLILLIVLVIGYLISCLFANVFSVCIDTVLLCYCYDKQEEGDDYFPSDLAKHVSKATLAKGKKLDVQKQMDQELGTHLNPKAGKEQPADLDAL